MKTNFKRDEEEAMEYDVIIVKKKKKNSKLTCHFCLQVGGQKFFKKIKY